MALILLSAKRIPKAKVNKPKIRLNQAEFRPQPLSRFWIFVHVRAAKIKGRAKPRE